MDLELLVAHKPNPYRNLCALGGRGAQLLRSPYVQAALRTALHTRLHMLNELNARGSGGRP